MKILDDIGTLPDEFAYAFLDDDHQGAYEIILPLANQGNASAQYTIGWFYYQGVYVTQSYDEAFKWYSISANKGMPEAQASLGLSYLSGHGTERNNQKAYYWLSLALKNGQTCNKQEIKDAKSNITIWQYLYINLQLLLKT